MCTAPIYIKNPYYKHQNIGDKLPTGSMFIKDKYEYEGHVYWSGYYKYREPFIRDKYGYLHDTQNAYIAVPCGKCASCIATKQNNIIQRFQLLALTHDIHMLTLTYSNDMIRTIEVNGYKHRYADITDIQKMFKRIRQANMLGTDFKYLYVTEYGGKKHRPHFHALIFTPKVPNESQWQSFHREKLMYDVFFKEWKRNVGKSDKYPVWKPLFEYHEIWKHGKLYKNFDFHTVRPDTFDVKSDEVSDVAYYVSKYVTKFDKWINNKQRALRLNLSDDEYKKVWDKLRPRCCISKQLFGKSAEEVCTACDKYIREKCIPYSLAHADGGFVFINPSTGKVSPMCRYLKHRYVTIADATALFFSQSADKSPLDSCPTPKDSITAHDNAVDAFRKQDKFKKSLSYIVDFDTSLCDDLFKDSEESELILNELQFIEDFMMKPDNSDFENNSENNFENELQ